MEKSYINWQTGLENESTKRELQGQREYQGRHKHRKVKLKDDEDLYEYIDQYFNVLWPRENRIEAMNEASVTAVLCFRKMGVPKDMRRILVNYLRRGTILSNKLKKVLKKGGIFRTTMRNNVSILRRVCKAMHVVHSRYEWIGIGNILQFVIEEDEEADEKEKTYCGRHMTRCFRSARWNARHGRCPSRQQNRIVWQLWASFDPPIPKCVSSRHIMYILCGGSVNMLNSLMVLPEWNLAGALELLCYSGMEKHVAHLLEHCTDSETKPLLKMEEALWTAVGQGHDDIVHLLLKNGAGVNARGPPMDNTVLMEAITQEREGNAKILITHGAQLEARNCYGYTPLMIAVGCRSTRFVQILIASGADVNAKDRDGYTALKMAMCMEEGRIIQCLKKAGATP